MLNLRIERLKKGLKQYELAKKAGVASCVLSQIETGKFNASPEMLKSLAKALGVSVKRIKGGE